MFSAVVETYDGISRVHTRSGLVFKGICLCDRSGSRLPLVSLVAERSTDETKSTPRGTPHKHAAAYSVSPKGLDSAVVFHGNRDTGDFGPLHFCSNRRCDDSCSETTRSIRLRIYLLACRNKSLVVRLGRLRLLVALIVCLWAFNTRAFAEALLVNIDEVRQLLSVDRADFVVAIRAFVVQVALRVFCKSVGAISLAFAEAAASANTEGSLMLQPATPLRRTRAQDL